MTYDVYGVGNVLVDIPARIEDSLLGRLEFPKGSMTLVDEATQSRVLGSLHGGAAEPMRGWLGGEYDCQRG